MARNTSRQQARAAQADGAEQYDKTVLVLQGGGALGAYQAGAYQALAAGGYQPDWIAGVSIGAINGAIIAGNPPQLRTARLREFWDRISRLFSMPAPDGDWPRRMFNSANSLGVTLFGLPGFFRPRIPSPWLTPQGAKGATSFYDTAPLIDTLKELVDFDRLNDGDIRLTLGAVDVEKGNLVRFDTRNGRIRPEHVLASGSLPPGFGPTEIDGRLYWDGGLVSNTPLAFVLREMDTLDRTLVFQVDLWSARGEAPRNLLDVEARRKDIIYSSRTRMNTNVYQRELLLREGLAKLAERLPAEALADPELAEILAMRRQPNISVVHLIYKRGHNDTHTRDYEFSRASMRDHWSAGLADAERTLATPAWLEARTDRCVGIRVFDMC